jgi:protein-disulfide isomerase
MIFRIPAVLRWGALAVAVIAGAAAVYAASTPPSGPATAPPPAAAGNEKSNFTPAQREEIQKLVHAYLLEHPEVLNEAIAALQTQDDAKRDATQKTALDSRHGELFKPAEDTVIGNPKGDVTVVEFFDYNCGYCKAMFPAMMDILKDDGNVRLVMKEFPILGPTSLTASKAALASVKQGKYSAFHMALLGYKGHLTDDTVFTIAGKVGLDVNQLHKDMNDPEIGKIIDRNIDLAQALQVTGTPALVVGTTVTPGALDKDGLKDLIAKARAKS